MKGIILLNGDPYSGKIITDGCYTVCCDGAMKWADAAGIKYDICIGDFDSLGFIPDNGEVYPVEKDKTDGEIALEILLEKGVSEIEIYGGSGRREDHFFGNVGLLVRAFENGIKAVFKSDFTEFFVADSNVVIDEPTGTTVSLVPISAYVHINGTKGLKYEAKGLTVRMGESRGLSNVTTLSRSEIEITEGTALIFIVRRL